MHTKGVIVYRHVLLNGENWEPGKWKKKPLRRKREQREQETQDTFTSFIILPRDGFEVGPYLLTQCPFMKGINITFNF